jgi:hypothetical protein
MIECEDRSNITDHRARGASRPFGSRAKHSRYAIDVGRESRSSLADRREQPLQDVLEPTLEGHVTEPAVDRASVAELKAHYRPDFAHSETRQGKRRPPVRMPAP